MLGPDMSDWARPSHCRPQVRLLPATTPFWTSSNTSSGHANVMSWAESSTHFVATAFRDAEMIRLRQRNETLRRAMESQGIRFADLAAATGKNVKTAQRWVYEGRTPRFAARERIAQVL